MTQLIRKIAIVVLSSVCFAVLTQVAHSTPCQKSTMTIEVNFTTISFTSPQFPANYPRPLSCAWLFKAVQGNRLVFRVNTFDVFPSIFCYRDLLTILDGELRYAPTLLSWCGSQPAGKTMRTSTGKALASLQTVTVGGAAQGFDFDVWAEQYNEPVPGTANYGPMHIALMGFASVVGLLFVLAIIVIIRTEFVRRKQMKEKGYWSS